MIFVHSSGDAEFHSTRATGGAIVCDGKDGEFLHTLTFVDCAVARSGAHEVSHRFVSLKEDGTGTAGPNPKVESGSLRATNQAALLVHDLYSLNLRLVTEANKREQCCIVLQECSHGEMRADQIFGKPSKGPCGRFLKELSWKRGCLRS